MASNIEVIVGNVGSVYYGTDRRHADGVFNDYVMTSKDCPIARCAGESVTMIQDGEIIREHVGTVDTDAE